jgi:hypothetical protein
MYNPNLAERHRVSCTSSKDAKLGVSRTIKEEFDNLANYNQDLLSKIRSRFKSLLMAA